MARPHIIPRLLSKKEAAAYLGYASAEVLDGLPIKPVRLNEIGAGSAPRYDRMVLDEFIDRRSGRCNAGPGEGAQLDADAALNDWKVRRAL